MKNGKKIDIDTMTIEHLRNTLKMIVRQCKEINISNEVYTLQELEAEYDAEDFGCK